MICPNCNHENQGGKFCENCGTNLTTASQTAAATDTINRVETPYYQNPQAHHNGAQPAQPAAANQYIETTKKISKLYFGYAMEVLKRPFSTSQFYGGEQFVNGIITMCLYALFTPLVLYFGLKGILEELGSFGGGLFDSAVESITPPFGDAVVKPFFGYLVFIFLVSAFTFGAIKLGKVQAGYKEVIARFGSFLLPITALLLVALLLSLLKMKFSFFILLFAIFGSITVVPALVIASFKRNTTEGLDVIYGTLLTYLATFITIYIMANILFESIKNAIGNAFNPFGM
ncbi:zinc ribbon domain-containing protein [Neobacillus sp. Marseille-QA0830]